MSEPRRPGCATIVRMPTPREIRELAFELAAAARSNEPGSWSLGSQALVELDDRGLLLLDEYARHWAPTIGAVPVAGTKGWLGSNLSEPTGFVAAVTSLHADGRIRQRATAVLATLDGNLALRALALRCFDHVQQVRTEALASTVARAHLDTAEAPLGVLLAARRRFHGRGALDAVLAHLEIVAGPRALYERVRDSSARDVRRWAHQYAHERALLNSDDLVALVQGSDDQFLRAQAAAWLDHVATGVQLQNLLGSRYADGRLLALTRLEDDVLGRDAILTALGDSSGRVREVAQWRARRRGIDPALTYRDWLGRTERNSVQLAAALDGLASLGKSSGDVDLVGMYLSHAQVRVRTAAVRAFARLGSTASVRERLLPMLHDPSPRVATAAAVALTRSSARAPDAELAWASTQSWTRRAAWRFSRATGSWDRVVADLRAATDTDAQLRDLGAAGLRNWLEHSAATTWGMPTPTQAERIAALLQHADLGEQQRRELAFHSGVTVSEPARPFVVPSAGDDLHRPGQEPRRRGFLRLLRRT